MEILCKSDEQSQACLSYAMTQPKFSVKMVSDYSWYTIEIRWCLNPCCNGRWSL